MLRNATIAPERAWNTWSARPAEMVYLPLGVRLTPLAYSGHAQRATLFAPGPDIALGAHHLDGALVDMTLSHAGTRLAWTWRKPDPYAVIARWRTLAQGEWGLRFWFNVCISAEGGEAVAFADGAAVVCVGTRYLAVCAGQPPVQVTGHDSIAAVAQDYETHGYFSLAARATQAPVLALRFNLEMMAEGRIAAAVADDPALAIARARSLAADASLWAPDDTPAVPAAAPAPLEGALEAIRDVMAWNGVYDEINQRCYTCISRHWNQQKFGGFGVWLDDQLYHALATGLFDAQIARENLAVALSNATPQGNLACLVTANDAWVDRTQIPVGAFVVRLLCERHADRSLAALAYATLARNHAWWWAKRDPLGRGLVSYGSSDLGQALYVGTSFGARNESSMDNSPIHDEAQFDPQTRTLTTIDVGLNSLLALDAQCLAQLARLLGRTEEAAALEARGEALCQRIRNELWDARRGIFANRLRDGRFVRSLGPTSFFPLICGAASTEQVESLLVHLDNPATFAGRFPLPSVSRDDPAFGDNRYWRGRIWPPLNFLVWQGLRRNGLHQRAGQLARDSHALFAQSWEKGRLCPENFNADTGAALDQPDTEGLYGWGVLMPMMAVAQTMEVGIWDGWEITNSGADTCLGPLCSPAGRVTVDRRGGCVTVHQGDRVLMSTDVPGRITRIRIEDGFISLVLPAHLPPARRLVLPQLAGRPGVCARLDDAPLTVGADGVLQLPAGDAPAARNVTITHR